MKKRIFDTIVIVLLIASLILTNFIMITWNLVTYAIDSLDESNIEFSVYLKDADGNKVTNVETAINSTDIVLGVVIDVKDNGYLNGRIELANNFKFKRQEIEGISQIEDHSISLQQINAGNRLEFEVGIEPNFEDRIDLSLLDSENQVALKGTYSNSKGEEGSIEKTQNLSITLIDPYEETEENAKLQADVITNKVFNINGEDKRILQILVKNGLEQDGYPIKQTNIEIEAPQVEKVAEETNTLQTGETSELTSTSQTGVSELSQIEKVLVDDRGTYATNGKEEGQNNAQSFSFTQDENKTMLTITNPEEEGKVSYKRQSEDNIIVTYVYDAKTDLTNKEIKLKSTIELYDKYNTTFEKDATAMVMGEEDQILQYEIISQPEIFKGKMYAKEEEEYKTVSKIDIRYPQIEENISITEGNATYVNGNYTKQATTSFVKSIINKEDLFRVIGDEGQLCIKSLDDVEIARIDKNTKTAEDGNIVVEYGENYGEVVFEIINAQNSGTININNVKKIQTENDAKEELQKVNGLKIEGVLAEANNVASKTVQTNIELKEPETKVEMRINKQSLVSEQINQNVEIQAVLLTDASDKDLYKNPVLQVEFPKEISEVAINNINVMHETELTQGKTEVTTNEKGNKVALVELQGEQTKHSDGNTIEGANVFINCDLTVKSLEEATSSEIVLTYANENATQYDNNGSVVSKINYIVKQKEEDPIVAKQNETHVAGLETEQSQKQADEQTNSETQEQQQTPNGQQMQDGQQEIQGQEAQEGQPQEGQPQEAAIEVGDITVKKQHIVVDSATNDIYEGQIQKYIITVTNNTNNVIENINVTDNIPEQAVYCIANKRVGYNNYFEEHPETTEYTAKIDSIEANGEEKLEYYTRIKPSTNGSTISGKAQAKIDGQDKVYESNEITSNIKPSKVQIDVSLATSSDVTYVAGTELEYTISVKNIYNETLNNLQIIEKIPEGTKYVSSKYLNYEEASKKFYEEYTENVSNKDYDESTETVKWKIEKLEPNEEIRVKLVLELEEYAGPSSKSTVYSVATVKLSDSEEYYSNVEDVKQVGNVVYTIKKQVSKQEVLEGEKFEYTITIKSMSDASITNATLIDELPEGVVPMRATYSIDGETMYSNSISQKLEESVDLGANEELVVVITVQADDIPDEKQEITVENKAYMEGKNMDRTETNTVTTVIKQNPEREDNNDDGDNNDGDNNDEDNNNGGNNGNEGNQTDGQKGSISGVIWVDENKNARRDSDEQLVANTEVKLLNENGSGIKSVTTDEKGAYKFSDLENGNYMIAFKYDSNSYSTTEYQKSGISADVNSDAIETQVKENGQIIKVGLTDLIKVESNNVTNIDLGLAQPSKFDLKLDKYISAVTVQTPSGTKTYKYGDESLAKVELIGKTINNTTISIRYKINVTNEGEVAGYATKIVDYMSSDLTFNANNNKGWTKQNNQLVCTNLKDVEIKPGETKTVELVLTKKMTESNTGTIVNTAEILEDYNKEGVKDVDSEAGNKMTKEDDISTVSLIVSIKTGRVYLYIGLILLMMIVLVTGIYEIKKNVLPDNN